MPDCANERGLLRRTINLLKRQEGERGIALVGNNQFGIHFSRALASREASLGYRRSRSLAGDRSVRGAFTQLICSPFTQVDCRFVIQDKFEAQYTINSNVY